jgi:hypothetical protein
MRSITLTSGCSLRFLVDLEKLLLLLLGQDRPDLSRKVGWTRVSRYDPVTVFITRIFAPKRIDTVVEDHLF